MIAKLIFKSGLEAELNDDLRWVSTDHLLERMLDGLYSPTAPDGSASSPSYGWPGIREAERAAKDLSATLELAEREKTERPPNRVY